MSGASLSPRFNFYQLLASISSVLQKVALFVQLCKFCISINKVLIAERCIPLKDLFIKGAFLSSIVRSDPFWFAQGIPQLVARLFEPFVLVCNLYRGDSLLI